MGYTHYWTYNPNAASNPEDTARKFQAAAELIRDALQEIKKDNFLHEGQAGGYDNTHPCLIRGGLGEGDPEITDTEIWFNGDEATGMDHETFSIQLHPKTGYVRDFCKTARKPYDLLVCFSLLALKHSFNNPQVFSFSSDGDNSEWETSAELYQTLSGINPRPIFPEE